MRYARGARSCPHRGDGDPAIAAVNRQAKRNREPSSEATRQKRNRVGLDIDITGIYGRWPLARGNGNEEQLRQTLRECGFSSSLFFLIREGYARRSQLPRELSRLTVVVRSAPSHHGSRHRTVCDYRDAMWLAHSVGRGKTKIDAESEEHTSELQSHVNLVC